MEQVRCKRRSVSSPAHLLGAISPREWAATAYFAGGMSIADAMTIRVKVRPCKGSCSMASHPLGR